MTDKVKLIIEIPKPMYEDIKSGKDGYSNYVHSAIRNGTPLDTVKGRDRVVKITQSRISYKR